MVDKLQCFGRLVDDKIVGYFGDGRHKFHLELRCSKNAVPGTKLCGKCHEKPREQAKNHPTVLHNLIDEAIPPWSHIYEGPWYRAKVAQYGEPSEPEMAKGKKAQLDATAGLGGTPLQLTIPQTTSPQSPGQAQGQAQGQGQGQPQPPSRNTSTQSFFVDSPKLDTPPKKKRGPKPSTPVSVAATIPLGPVPAPAIVPTMAIESNELVLDDYEVVKIKVRLLKHEGTPYFLDTRKQKLYAVGADGRPMHYIGQWNPRNQTIHTDVSDSD